MRKKVEKIFGCKWIGKAKGNSCNQARIEGEAAYCERPEVECEHQEVTKIKFALPSKEAGDETARD